MGYFMDAFDISSGLTLGSRTAEAAFEYGGQVLSRSLNRATSNYRAQNYDPIVRDDLNNLLVLGSLRRIAYPFPVFVEEAPPAERPQNFFIRHKIFTLCLIWFVYTLFQYMNNESSGNYAAAQTDALLVVFSFLVMAAAGAGAALMKTGRIIGTASKKLSPHVLPTEINKTELEKYGRQYWKIREYVRMALDEEEFSPQEGLRKLTNTALVS